MKPTDQPIDPVSLLSEEKQAHIRVMEVFSFAVQIMFAGVIQRYTHRINDKMQERGLYRHMVKKHAKELQALIDQRMRWVYDYDRDITATSFRIVAPHLVDRYIEDGGSHVQGMLCYFEQHFGNQLNLIYFSVKNLVDYMKLPNSDLLADIWMLDLFAESSFKIYYHLEHIIDNASRSIGGFKASPISDFYKKLKYKSLEIIVLLTGGKLTEGEVHQNPFYKDVVQLAADFNGMVACKETIDDVQNCIAKSVLHFAEYTCAYMRVALGNKTLSRKDLKLLLYRLGCKSNVRVLFRCMEERYPYDPVADSDLDLQDMVERIPPLYANSDGSPDAITRFIRLCAEDRTLIIGKDEELVRAKTHRILRREARRDGVLSEETLRILYKRAGTKKGVQEVLLAAGFELLPTIKLWRTTRVTGWELDDCHLDRRARFSGFKDPRLAKRRQADAVVGTRRQCHDSELRGWFLKDHATIRNGLLQATHLHHIEAMQIAKAE